MDDYGIGWERNEYREIDPIAQGFGNLLVRVVGGMILELGGRLAVMRERLAVFTVVIMIVRQSVTHLDARRRNGNRKGRESTKKWEARKSHHGA